MVALFTSTATYWAAEIAAAAMRIGILVAVIPVFFGYWPAFSPADALISARQQVALS